MKTTEQSLEIISEIQKQNGATLKELLGHFDLSRSTLYKHLQTLSEHGYVAKEGEVYHIGLRFLNHGEYARSRKQAYTLSNDAIYELADRTNEESEFIVENNGRGIVVYQSYHPQSQYEGEEGHGVVNQTTAGTYYNLHSIAAGKAILAELPQERVDEIVDCWGLPERTEHTITDRDELYSELEQVQESGIAFNREEFEHGLHAVARRVLEPDGSILGAIAINAPAYRLKGSTFTDQVPELLIEIANNLEENVKESYIRDAE